MADVRFHRRFLFATALLLTSVSACMSADNTDTEEKSGDAAETIVLVADEKADKDHVRPQVLLPVDRLPAGRKIRLAVVLDVEKGWHINTNPPRPEFTQPTTVSVKAKHGTKLAGVDYPTGRDLVIEGFDEPVSVYEGRVLLFGTLEIPATAARQTEELTVEIKFQACNEKLCLAPKTTKLIGKVPVAAQGDPVKQINQEIFDKDEQEKRRRTGAGQS